jgi:transposase-like protein
VEHIPRMQKSDVQCPKCEAGYRRIEVSSLQGEPGEFRCLICNQILEGFTGTTHVAYRLTVQPEKTFG